MAVRAVLFDLDGTLWGDAPGWKGDEADFARLTELEARRLAPVFAAGAIQVDPLTFVGEFWAFARRREEEEAVVRRAPNGPGLVSELLELKGVQVDARRAFDAWAALDVSAAEYGRALFADTISTLAAVARSGLGMAVVSNRLSGVSALRADFQELGIDQHFRALVCSAQVGWRKPHPAMFEKALRELGASPSEAVMVGDSFENDVRGARALGITAVLKLNGREATAEEKSGADYLIDDLSQLFELGLFKSPPRT